MATAIFKKTQTKPGRRLTSTEKRPTRKNGKHLRVPVLLEEELAIKENARKAGLSTGVGSNGTAKSLKDFYVLTIRSISSVNFNSIGFFLILNLITIKLLTKLLKL